jgi:nitrogen PTS system EIIA component
MKIEDFLTPDDVLVGLRVADKAALLAALAERAGTALGIDGASIAGELSKREELGSTGVGAGLAIPHARLAGLPRPFGILARLGKAIDFAAVDARPVDIVFLLLLPAAAAGDQLTALATVTRRLRDPKRIADVRISADAGALYEAMTAE